MIRFEWKRDNVIYLVTVKMGMVFPTINSISHGNLQIITNYRRKCRGILPS